MPASHLELVPVPRGSVTFPVAVPPPPGFSVCRPATWPAVEGRLEYAKGTLLYMPRCGEEQSAVVAAVSWLLVDRARRTPGFDVGSNEAGVLLEGEVRGIDAAVWRRTRKKRSTRFRRTAPVLAVEVQGEDESLDALRLKARWYIAHGTATVWLVLPAQREVVVLTGSTERRVRASERLPQPAGLRGLTPAGADLFR